MDENELRRALAHCQNVALIYYPGLQGYVRKMLFALDRYWRYEGHCDWATLWWETYERNRGHVESLLRASV